MAKKRLSDKEIDELLSQYHSERRRLSFQLEQVREAIDRLKSSRGITKPEAGENAPVKRGPGRPRKETTPVRRARRKPGRRKKRVVKAGYRLSDWDQLVIRTITSAGRLLTKEELLKASLAWAKKNAKELGEADVEGKLTRVLQKLSGKRGELGTYASGLRRGYHYGIKDWFFASSGKLRKQHLDKLVLVSA